MAKFIIHMSWRVQGMPGATQQGPRERARWIMSEPGPVLCLVGVNGGVLGVSSHCLLVIKDMREN